MILLESKGSSGRTVSAFNSLHIALSTHSGSEDWKLSPWHWNITFQTWTLRRPHWFFFISENCRKKINLSKIHWLGQSNPRHSLAEHSSVPIRNVMCLHVVPQLSSRGKAAKGSRSLLKILMDVLSTDIWVKLAQGIASLLFTGVFEDITSKLCFLPFHSVSVEQLGLRPLYFLIVFKSYFPHHNPFFICRLWG